MSLKKISINNWAVVAALAIVVFTIYGNIYRAPFVFDDLRSIRDNPVIHSFSACFAKNQILYSRGIVDCTFALNYKLGRLNVAGYHAVNVIIHLLAGWAAYLLSLTVLRLALFGRSPESVGALQDAELKSGGMIEGDQYLRIIAFATALFFVSHPLQTQSVTYIVQRYASMAGLFYLLSVYLYLQGRIRAIGMIPAASIDKASKARDGRLSTKSMKQRDPGGKKSQGERRTDDPAKIYSSGPSSPAPWVCYGCSVVCGLLALFSKQSAASLPLAIMMAEFVLVDGSWEGWKRKLPWFLMILLLWALIIMHLLGVLDGISAGGAGRGLLDDVAGTLKETEKVTRYEYALTQLSVIVIYLRLIFFPAGQTLDYSLPFSRSFFDGYTSLAFLFLVFLFIVAFRNIKRRPVVAFGIFWFFITLSVESSILPIRDAIFEHRVYPGLFGIALAFCWGLYTLLRARLKTALFLTALITLSLGVATFARNSVWADELRLWNDVVTKRPDNLRGRLNLGYALSNRGRHDEAIARFRAVIKALPREPTAYYNMGKSLLALGKVDEGLEYYNEALRLNPDYQEAHYNLGVHFQQAGDAEKALYHYRKALEIKPGDLETMTNLAGTLARQGRFNEGKVLLMSVLQADPDNPMANSNMGSILLYEGKYGEASQYYSRALRADPYFELARQGMASVRTSRARLDSRISQLEKELDSGKKSIESHLLLAQLLKRKGNTREALRSLRAALELEPGDRRIAMNIARIHASDGDYKEAEGLYREILQEEPGNLAARRDYADLLGRRGSAAEAIDQWKELLARDSSSSVDASYRIASLHAAEGRVNEAVRWLERAVREGFVSWDRIKMDKNLDSIRATEFYAALMKGR